MNKFKLILLALMILVPSLACGQSGTLESSADDAMQSEILLVGSQLLAAGKPEEAITESFDKIIRSFKSEYGKSKKQVYCARTLEERLMYLLMAVSAEDTGQEKGDVIVISPVWSDAYFMKGYALIELGRIPEAKRSIEQALVLSPNNSQYLAELGYIYQAEKKWAKAVEIFQAAEEAVALSPEEKKKDELGRARRGLGYTFIEMGQFDEAEEKYRQCLEANPNDEIAREELEYIQTLRAQ